MKRRTFTRQLTFSLITGALAAAQAFAQGTPPAALTQTQAPIKLIVPFTPGTGMDTIAYIPDPVDPSVMHSIITNALNVACRTDCATAITELSYKWITNIAAVNKLHHT